jgi:hypothetical protein
LKSARIRLFPWLRALILDGRDPREPGRPAAGAAPEIVLMIRILVFLTVIASPFLSFPGTDAGCGWDPSGQCQPAPQIDAGCIWDPSGQCRS